MNRHEEYLQLLQELENTPVALEYTAQKASARYFALQKKQRRWTVSFGSFAACFVCFVVLVNCMPTFAQACGRVPFLSALAETVRFSPSLTAAVENEYVQPIGLSQTQNGITATVEHVIVDRKQVSIFFTLSADFTDRLDYRYSIDAADRESGWSSSSGSYGRKNGELRQIDVNFMECDVADTLYLSLKVYDSGAQWEADRLPAPEKSVYDAPTEEQAPSYLAEFDFTLEFDPYFTAQGQIIPVNSTFSLNGQQMTLTEVEVYPTHLRVNLDDDPDNKVWLKGLDLYLENEYGERFESSINGVTASGDPDGEGYATFWLDSPFFSRGEHLTLHITGARWLEKQEPQVRVDLTTQTAEGLAEDVQFLGAKRRGNTWWVSFIAPQEADGGMYQLFESSFYDGQGNTHDITRWSSTMGYWDAAIQDTLEFDTMFTEEFPLEGLQGTVAYLTPVFSHSTNLSGAPISIPIR